MKIFSYNVRGLGCRLTWRKIRTLLCSEDVDMVFIQETKLKVMEKTIWSALWGGSEFEWLELPVNNSAGGLLCIWRKEGFVLTVSFNGMGYMGFIGKWKEVDQNIIVVNIYAPCKTRDKKSLWDALL
ncbi:hypothetical protein JHK87_034559 [Glycine soja]|nr:hypothetical protein JHK87_034559 [Glycine soja]